jgi:hypothetical protein
MATGENVVVRIAALCASLRSVPCTAPVRRWEASVGPAGLTMVQVCSPAADCREKER